jgi:hypothetical protein
MLFLCKEVQAQYTCTWAGGSSGNWNSSANWSIAGVTGTSYPGNTNANDIVNINSSTTISVTALPKASIAQLNIANGAVVTLTLATGMTLNITGTVTVGTSSTATLNFNGPGAVTGTSAITLNANSILTSNTTASITAASLTLAAGTTATINDGATFSGAINVNGSSTISGTSTVKGASLPFGGSYTFTAAATLINITGAASINTGTITLANNASGGAPTLDIGGGISNPSTGTIAFTATNPGTVNLTGNVAAVGGGAFSVGSGVTMNLASGTMTQSYYGYTFTNMGTINVAATYSINYNQGACTTANSGTIKADGTVYFYGSFSNSGTITAENGITFTVFANSTPFTNTGTININPNTALTANSAFVISGSGCTFQNTSPGSITITGISGNTTTLFTISPNTSTIANTGSISATNAAVLWSANAFSSINNSGSITLLSSPFTISNGTTFTNTGTFSATSSTQNFGSSSGAAVNILNTSPGTFTLASSSTFNYPGNSASFQNTGTVTVTSSNMNFSGNVNYLQNSGSGIVSISGGSTVTVSAGCGIKNSSSTATFTAGTSGSACIITLNGLGAYITNTGIFNLASTSIIYPTAQQTIVSNTSPGIFTLLSDANGSAAIGPLNTTSGNLATCTGTFNIQRYYQGSTIYDNVKKRWLGRNYRIISSPVNIAPTGSSNYFSLNYIVGTTAGQTTGANSATNAFITGCTGGSTSLGNPSVYVFRESYTPANGTFTDGNFLGVTNITNMSSTGAFTASDGNSYSMVIGTGVFFFFRGAATSWSTRTVAPYLAPENVTLTSTGTINQQSVTVKDWYTPTSSNLAVTGTGTGGNHAVRGFNMVGNPYPCTIDWCTAYSNTGITRVNVNPTIYEYDPVTDQYDTFMATSSSGGIPTGNGSRYIMSGQGFFVTAVTGSPSLIFTESAKAATQQLTLGNLLLGTPVAQTAGNQLMRLKLSIDSLNYDDIAISFNSSASTSYNPAEDAAYLAGANALEGLSSYSADSVKLSINSLPLPKLTPEVIRLSVQAHVEGSYTLQKTALDAIPQLYEIWLMDDNKKDSLDMRANSTYTFDVSFADTTSYGNNRFQLVIRENPALMVHLLNFTGSKTADGSQIVWTTENEQNYTNFTVQRSSDGGATFSDLGGMASSALGTYSYLDKNPPVAADRYRLKIQDLNGTISYSDIVTLMYANTTNTIASNISVYPNPASGVLNLAIQPNNANLNLTSGLSALQTAALSAGLSTSSSSDVSYDIKIISITGSVVKTATSAQSNWQDNVAALSPGTYVIQVVNNKDNSLVGRSTFVKL